MQKWFIFSILFFIIIFITGTQNVVTQTETMEEEEKANFKEVTLTEDVYLLLNT